MNLILPGVGVGGWGHFVCQGSTLIEKKGKTGNYITAFTILDISLPKQKGLLLKEEFAPRGANSFSKS